MLEVSQLQSRDLTRTKAPFDVCESMRRVLISMEKKITDRGLDVDADIPDSGIMVLGAAALVLLIGVYPDPVIAVSKVAFFAISPELQQFILALVQSGFN